MRHLALKGRALSLIPRTNQFMANLSKKRLRFPVSLARSERLEEIFREELEFILESELGDVAFTGVEIERVSQSFNQARADVWFMSGILDSEQTLEAFQRARSFLRYRLADAVSLKRIPELHFLPVLGREVLESEVR
jgi:ribosome-binding factor A